ncbi:MULTISPECIES: NAD(P)-binding domain-containing protein [Paenibacillus]|uniref:NAD(P)-dependent oxidoreductase n=1 Tax=Paenibacillus TaxID=44249 RepID=UPI00188D9954|nr:MULTISPECIES: NAD(P)-binding domain-containing protein [Paenibacillus]MBX4148163.1 NAD(P)-binding domain-containing protein [Paenibacillus lautus]
MSYDQSKREERSPVTVIGLGEMGQALAGVYLRNGYPTTVWNRTAAKADTLVKQGAVLAATPAEAVQASPVVIVCVLDYDAVHEILDPLGDILKDRVVFNLTNGTPMQARSTAKWAKERGYDYIDAGIMAVPQIIGTEAAFILYSGGDKKSFDTNKKLLDVMGAANYVGADAGLASLLDLAMNGAMYGMLGGAMHAIAVVGTEGVKAQDFSSGLLIPYLTAITGIIPNLARQFDTREFSVGVSAKLAMQQVGFRNIRQASKDQGISTELLDPIQSLMDRRVAAGFPDDDFSAVTELLKEQMT